MKKPHLVLIAVLALSLLSCNLSSVTSQGVQPSDTPQATPTPAPPQVWIDFPTQGEVAPLAPYQVIFHGSDPDGVVRVEFSVNGKVEVTQDIDANSMPVGKRQWTPPAPGAYTIQIRMQNTDGLWSDYASVAFTVAEPTAEPSSTPTEEPTAAPTYTATPTETATETPEMGKNPTLTVTIRPSETPKVALSAVDFDSTLSAYSIDYGPACTPAEVTFTVNVSGSTPVFSVVLFTRMKDLASGAVTPWASVRSMKPTPDFRTFTLKIDVSKLPDAMTYDQSTVYYQYVATDKDGKIIGRSVSFFDLTIQQCH